MGKKKGGCRVKKTKQEHWEKRKMQDSGRGKRLGFFLRGQAATLVGFVGGFYLADESMKSATGVPAVE